MENPANYSSLIQLAVTFNFVFVVFRHESEDKAKMLIDTFIEKWRKIFQEETNALFTAIQEMVYNKFSILKEKPVISKYHEELKKNYRSFQELISWYPKYLPRYCMMSGLYSLILLILLAELNFNNNLGVKTIELFLSFLVIYQLAYNGYYIIIEILQKRPKRDRKIIKLNPKKVVVRNAAPKPKMGSVPSADINSMSPWTQKNFFIFQSHWLSLLL